MTFKEYLVGRSAGFDAVGDFIRLARADGALPEAADWGALRAYFEARQDYQAAEVGQKVWEDYQAKLRGDDRQRRRPPAQDDLI